MPPGSEYACVAAQGMLLRGGVPRRPDCEERLL
jgi:hypothetical protein